MGLGCTQGRHRSTITAMETKRSPEAIGVTVTIHFLHLYRGVSSGGDMRGPCGCHISAANCRRVLDRDHGRRATFIKHEEQIRFVAMKIMMGWIGEDLASMNQIGLVGCADLMTETPPPVTCPRGRRVGTCPPSTFSLSLLNGQVPRCVISGIIRVNRLKSGTPRAAARGQG